MAGRLAAENGQHGSADGQRAEDVGVEHGTDLLSGAFLHRVEKAPTRVVDQYVDPLETFHCRRGRLLGLGLVCHVEANRQESASRVGQRLVCASMGRTT